MVLFLIIPIFLGKLRTGLNVYFWVYYFCLFVFGVVAAYHLKLSALLSLVLAAWIMGNVSEYMGSSIGLWRFCATPEGSETARSIACWSPPPYLTFGCWPLIFLSQMGLSFFLSQEHMNMRAEDKANPWRVTKYTLIAILTLLSKLIWKGMTFINDISHHISWRYLWNKVIRMGMFTQKVYCSFYNRTRDIKQSP